MSVKTEIQEIQDKLQPHALEYVKVIPIAQEPMHLWSSKLAGKPYWPKEKTYPCNKNAEPLVLLAQINFAEVPTLDGYPAQGILQFFIEDDDELYGLNCDISVDEAIEQADGYRIIYHKDVIKNETLLESGLPCAALDSDFPIANEYALQFELDKEFPSPTDYRFEQICGDVFEMDEAVGEYLYDNYESMGSKIGGYAHFTQEDPRGYEKPDEKWVLLFQLDSQDDEGVDVMWGDCGVANFFIEPSALQKMDFSRVWYNWDCS
ncbi:hypothetical protein A7985_03910 [Pseudoalteromonas luteoviolacea]|uniref:DUF1963 domain-containing protein n=1 Tax=Pseudoalteromonas luteoviolacea TaxID=43657 RepID=A0A1C0TV45_9GAMM|nr:YwqG family protein [Pseudoalteromonas luteoviolacea]MBQ4812460.1 DUF1963 domain-containing protein [Pseudoalteromonas luteoviolacea]OCQ23104.1 hypothetical protein A7985_03910 [Pseudoalteromonas luteoviolacea]